MGWVADLPMPHLTIKMRQKKRGRKEPAEKVWQFHSSVIIMYMCMTHSTSKLVLIKHYITNAVLNVDLPLRH
jgi:hypothetical protein